MHHHFAEELDGFLLARAKVIAEMIGEVFALEGRLGDGVAPGEAELGRAAQLAGEERAFQ